MTTFSFVNLLIGYLLVIQEKSGLRHLLPFFIAMAFIFVVNDRSLNRNFKDLYSYIGRWILMTAVMLGWAISYFLGIPDIFPAVLEGFVAGGTILNVLKEEIPKESESTFWAFALGAFAYAAILLAI